MSITVDYTDDPNYSYTLQSPVSYTLIEMSLALQTVTDVTRVVDTTSWKTSVYKVETTDELATIYQKTNFTVDANTT